MKKVSSHQAGVKSNPTRITLSSSVKELFNVKEKGKLKGIHEKIEAIGQSLVLGAEALSQVFLGGGEDWLRATPPPPRKKPC